jgi:hypothetical protein
MSMFKLSQNHGVDIPKHVVSLDTEAWVSKDVDADGNRIQTLRYFEMAFSRRKGDHWTRPTWWKGNTYQEAWDALDEIGEMVKHGRVWVAGHNIAYDWRILGLDNYIGRKGWDQPKMFNTRQPFLVYARRGDVTYDFISTTNLYMASLRKLAPDFGMEKLGENLDMKKLDDYPEEVIAPYCHRDVEIVLTIMQKHAALVKDGDMGSFRPTIAGQAHNFWRHRFMPKDTMTVYDSYGLIEMEKSAYRGGRCEVFHLGPFNDCYQVDVHSMYPWAMKEVPYPIEPLASTPLSMGLEDMMEHIQEGHHVIADCALELKRPIIGMKRDQMLLFPVGKVRTTIDLPEIQYLLSHPNAGSIKKVFRFIPYLQGEVGFKEYIDHWFEIKRSQPEGSYQYRNAKLMMNALYGKMGQRYFGDIKEVPEEECGSLIDSMDDLGQDALDEPKGGVYYRVGEKILYRPARSEKFAWHAMPRIPAKVCSMARMRLQELMDIAGKHHYYNCDTDSLIVDARGLENLESAGELSDELGKLGKVGPASGTIFANKEYTFGEAVKRKGIKKEALEIGPRIFEQEQMVTGFSSYWDGTRFGVKVVTVRKDLNAPYLKGTETQSGWVEPLVLAEW